MPAFRLALVLLALAAAYIRFSAIDWGAPYVLDPDEHIVVHRALDMVRAGDPNPRWFAQPSLFVSVQAALTAAVEPFAGAPLESNYLANGIAPSEVLPSQWPFVLGGRIAVALAAVAAVLCTALAGARFFGPAVGCTAAAFLVVSPLANSAAHVVDAGTLASALATLSLVLAAGPRARWFWAGIVAGLAAGTAYAASIILLGLVVLAANRDEVERIVNSTRLATGALIGFLVATPFLLLDPAHGIAALVPLGTDESSSATSFDPGQVAEAARRMFDGASLWAGTAARARSLMEYLYRDALGPVMGVLALLGIVRAAADAVGASGARHERVIVRALLLPVLAGAFWYSMQPDEPRVLVIVLPLFCLLAAMLLLRVAQLLRPDWLAVSIFFALAAAGVGSSLLLVLDGNARMRLPDTRLQALAWIDANLPAGTKLARETQTPLVSKQTYNVTFVPLLAHRPFEWYAQEEVEYLVASSGAYGPIVGSAHPGDEPAGAFYKSLFSLPLAAEFAPAPGTTGPVIRIYRRTRAAPPRIA